MCKGEGCPLKEKCKRFTSKPFEAGQYFFKETPYDKDKKECNYFWDKDE
jgi:hypothetical protein